MLLLVTAIAHSNSHSNNSVCRILESLEGCFAKCYHVSLGLGKWRGVLAQMGVCGPQAFRALGRHCLHIWPAAVSQEQEPLTTGPEEEAEGLNSGDSFSWHAGVVTFLPLMYDLGLA